MVISLTLETRRIGTKSDSLSRQDTNIGWNQSQSTATFKDIEASTSVHDSAMTVAKNRYNRSVGRFLGNQRKG